MSENRNEDIDKREDSRPKKNQTRQTGRPVIHYEYEFSVISVLGDTHIN